MSSPKAGNLISCQVGVKKEESGKMKVFQKRHYNAIADVMKRQKPADNWVNKKTQWTLIVRDMADTFSKDNENFKKDTFFRACGLDFYPNV